MYEGVGSRQWTLSLILVINLHPIFCRSWKSSLWNNLLAVIGSFHPNHLHYDTISCRSRKSSARRQGWMFGDRPSSLQVIHLTFVDHCDEWWLWLVISVMYLSQIDQDHLPIIPRFTVGPTGSALVKVSLHCFHHNIHTRLYIAFLCNY